MGLQVATWASLLVGVIGVWLAIWAVRRAVSAREALQRQRGVEARAAMRRELERARRDANGLRDAIGDGDFGLERYLSWWLYLDLRGMKARSVALNSPELTKQLIAARDNTEKLWRALGEPPGPGTLAAEGLASLVEQVLGKIAEAIGQLPPEG